MRNADSLDKVIGIYLAGLCRKQFTYKSKQFLPKLVHVSPLLVRGFTCPEGCGACCGKFSLDFLEGERLPREAEPRFISINGESKTIYSDRQIHRTSPWCRNLNQRSGRCGIYDHRPLSCDFELIRILQYEDKCILTQKQYGRSWAMKRIDEECGTLCEMLPPDPFTISEVDRKLQRLQDWAEYLQIFTCIGLIRAWLSNGNFHRALLIPVDRV